MYSPANIYFARRPEVSKFPFEIILKICNETNKGMDMCIRCSNYMKYMCRICGVCDHCNYAFNDVKLISKIVIDVIEEKEENEAKERVHICNQHLVQSQSPNKRPVKFCKQEDCGNILISVYYSEQEYCSFHDLKCFKCGNSFKTHSALVYHLHSYHHVLLW